ncbi:CPBP family glutamic-type intramembrane protease [Alloscardovia macacae]|uniref:CAAX prenyl protease 2/Lysostaphin resistance protein A-like domain-containing protein n=1 Tax=Alloscardovia macacae TaxID=1160091 RepID=A0A261F482_9BIFI|nr:CPBP family glutamic-type intramembrane protease [Alloscardovia macacae]OZG53726.1 hypothetical protein ALMA_1291 [Alloscardovia macacae]
MEFHLLISGALFIAMVMTISGVGLTMRIKENRKVVALSPIILGCVTFLVSFYLFFLMHIRFNWLIYGNWKPSWLSILLGVSCGIVIVPLAFWIEAWLTQLWYKKHISKNLTFLYMPVIGRSEAMDSVAQLAHQRFIFLWLSGVSSFGEEFFYRGVFLLGGMHAVHQSVITILLVQAVFYGINHIAFGVPAIIGKTILGLMLGVVAIIGGAFASFLLHLGYQYLVAKQFMESVGEYR